MIAAIGPASAGCRDHDGSSSTAPHRIFVSNESAGTVTVIDDQTDAVIATIPVGKRPRGLRVAPDGKTLFVALSGSPRGGPGVDESTLPPPDRAADGIGVVDVAAHKLVRVLPSGPDPESFDIIDGGKTLVVSNEDTGEASIVDVASGAIRARIKVGREPEGVTATPDGSFVYVTSEGDARVDVINPHAARVVATIPTGQRPRAVVFTPDGRTALVTNEADGTVTVIDAVARTAIATIPMPHDADTVPRPMGVARTRDGATAFVTTGRGGALAIVDVGARSVTAVIPHVGARPWGVAVDSRGRVITANGSSNDVAIIDPKTAAVTRRISVGDSPWGVASYP